MDSLVDDAKGAILDFELHRLHYTYSMIDLHTFREDYRYVYLNGGSAAHSVAPLLWRNRAVQANMYVLDAANSNLIYLPSGITREATHLSIRGLIQTGLKNVTGQPLPSQPPMSVPTPGEILAGLAFESPRLARDLVYSKVLALARRFPTVTEFSKAAALLLFSFDYYLPLALLPEAIKPGQLAFLRHGVDIYRPVLRSTSSTEYRPLGVRVVRLTLNVLYSIITRRSRRWRLARLFFGGRYDFEVPLALDAVDGAGARSFHLRVVVPPGLRVAGPVELRPENVFGERDLLRFASYDESNVYLYLGRDEVESILKRRDEIKREKVAELAKTKAAARAETLKSLKVKLTKPTVSKWIVDALEGLLDTLVAWMDQESKVHMSISIPLAFAAGIIPLIVFLWVPALIMVLAAVYGAMTLDVFIASLGVLFVVVLSAGIFAIDRRVLTGLVLRHAILALAVGDGAFALSRVF